MKSGFVAILGWTNVGKSTLLNRLVGEKLAAVSDVPQTTRNRITGVRPVTGGGQIVFLDTPGFHNPRERMNRMMVETARNALKGADLALLVVDAAHGFGPGDETAAKTVKQSGVPALGVLNKIDLIAPKSRLLDMMRMVVDVWKLEEAIPISATSGEGCDVLVERVLAHLPDGPPPFPADYLTDQPERLLAAEWIREKLMHHTRQEIPHSTAVMIERWQEREDGLVEIEATVLVERESQKGIVIGKGGRMLKQVGTEARHDIEKLLGAHVFLRLHVEVRGDWRNDRRTLSELGFE